MFKNIKKGRILIYIVIDNHTYEMIDFDKISMSCSKWTLNDLRNVTPMHIIMNIFQKPVWSNGWTFCIPIIIGCHYLWKKSRFQLVIKMFANYWAQQLGICPIVCTWTLTHYNLRLKIKRTMLEMCLTFLHGLILVTSFYYTSIITYHLHCCKRNCENFYIVNLLKLNQKRVIG